MLSRILNAMLLPNTGTYHAVIEHLLKLLVEMEEVVRKLPDVEVQRYHEEWNPG